MCRRDILLEGSFGRFDQVEWPASAPFSVKERLRNPRCLRNFLDNFEHGIQSSNRRFTPARPHAILTRRTPQLHIEHLLPIPTNQAQILFYRNARHS